MPEKFKVVISGMSGRFPECGDVLKFKEKLYDGDEFVTLDDRKWPVGYRYKFMEKKMIPDHTGKMSNIHKVDYTVFKLSSSIHNSNDIMNRVSSEPSFEAIVDAGINPYSLDGSNIGVFMSTGLNECEVDIFDGTLDKNVLATVGTSKSMMSNRISFALNLTGPSFANFVDMHGGLESLSLAYKYVSEGFVEAAIVGAVNSIREPLTSLQFTSLGILCSDGITRPFDQWANGCARSEGAVCFYLQRAEDAKRNYGEIKLCDFSFDGSRLSNFIGFGEEYIIDVLKYLYGKGEFPVDSHDLGYVEMNAYGNKIMDKAESKAVAELLTKNRMSPLLVGSIKSNIGHTESSSGFMGVLKALFALETGSVAPNKYLTKLNSGIPAFREERLQVVTEQTHLPGNTVAVNCIGLCGSIGLTLVKQHEKSIDENSHIESSSRILLICGRNENDLKDKLAQIRKLPYDRNFIALMNDSLGQYMPLHSWRGFTILPAPAMPICDVEERGGPNRPIWFIFSGMGSQWNTMGKSLLNLPLFAEIVAKCDLVLRKKNIDIYNILTSDDPRVFDDILHAFVGIITIQIGLYEILKALGIEPDGIIGHSVGEHGCAYADSCLSLEQAVLASWARGVASTEVQTIKGMMAAVGKGYAAMKDTLPDDIQVACHNSVNSCTISGPVESVNQFVKKLQKDRIFAKAVNVANIAYHSKYIASVGPNLLDKLKEVIPEPRQRSSKWISTSVSKGEWETPLAQHCSAEYMTNNLLSPVFFEEGCKYIPENAICIEFAPHGLLQAILKRSLPESCTNVSLTSRVKGPENLNFLLSSIGRLYINGLEPQVNNIFPSVEYPVPRGTPSISPYCTWYHIDEPIPPSLKSKNRSCLSKEVLLICTKEDSDYVYLKDHEVNGETTIPLSFFVYLAWWVFSFKRMETIGTSSVIVEDVKIYKLVTLKDQEIKYTSVMIQMGSGYFEIIMQDEEESEKFEVIATGRISIATKKVQTTQTEEIAEENGKLIPKKEFYDALATAGYNLGDEFCLVNDLHFQESEYRTNVIWNGNWVTFLDALMKIQMFGDNDGNIENIFPNRFRKLEIDAAKFQSLKKGSEVSCKSNTITKQLSCKAISLSDLRYKSFPTSKIQFNKLRFVPYHNPRCHSVLEFFILSLQIATENLNTIDKRKLVLVDDTNTHKYSRIMGEIIKEKFFSFPVTLLSSGNLISTDEDVLIITDDVDEIDKRFASIDSLSILFISPFTCKSSIKVPHLFIEITSQLFAETKITLLKRKCVLKKQPSLFTDNNQNGQNGNMIGLSSYFVVYRNIGYSDLLMMTSKKEQPNTKYLYIMDEIENGQLLQELVENQMKKNLSVSILKEGEWGSYRNLSSEIYQKCGFNFVEDAHFLPNVSHDFINLDYICFYDDPMLEKLPTEKVRNFAYSALTNNNEKVVGLATATSQLESLHCDPHLFWTIPTDWSLKDAVTIPYFYAQESGIFQTHTLLAHQYYAYRRYEPTIKKDRIEDMPRERDLKLIKYHDLGCQFAEDLILPTSAKLPTYTLAFRLLFSKFRPMKTKTVMINVGKEYFLAEALVVLSTSEDLEIFLTIGTDEEAELFKLKFPEIPLDHILRSQNCSYEIETRNMFDDQGIDLVINCLSGVQHVEACLRCLSMGGIYMEFGPRNCSEYYNIGLNPFLRLKSFYVVQNKISDLLELPVQTKQKIKKMIEQCLRKGMIKPPELDPRSTDSTRMNIVKCHSKSEIQNNGTRAINYDSKHSYLIVGTGIDNAWFRLVKWLITQGAREFIIALEKYPLLDRSIEYQINKLLAKQNLKVFLTSSAKLENKEEVDSFLKESEGLAPLEAVFFVSFRGHTRKISNLDSVVSPDVCFIGLSSDGLKEFEHRHMRGSPAIFFHCEKSKNILAVFPHLNQILSQDDNNNAEVLYQVTDPVDRSTQMKTAPPSLCDLRNYLPQDIETLIRIGQENIKEPTFVEVTTLSKRMSYCKGVYPVFVLPAVHSIMLKPLFRQLVYPAFSATTTSAHSIKYTAQELYQSLTEIQPSGPVTIISEAWTLPVALELISHVQFNSRKYRMFVLEGNPENWLDRVSREKYSAFYADEIFHFDKKTKREHHSHKSFEDVVEIYAKNACCDARMIDNVIRGAKIIQDKMEKLPQIQLPNMLLENITFFERYHPADQTFNLSTTSEIIVVNEPTYRNLLTNPRIGKMINENAEYSWWDFTDHESI